MTETASSWYVAKTRPNAETKALCNLERQGFKAYLPRYLRRVSHARKVRWLPRPLFPTYLFVALSPTQQRWRAINSTFGIAGLWDVAGYNGIEGHREDFGQTLGVWGVEPGPYIILPVMGPSNLRDFMGRGVDNAFDPLNWTEFEDRDLDNEIMVTRTVVGAIATRERLIETIETLRDQPEPYIAMRRNYTSQRQAAIRNGKIEDDPYKDLPDFDDFDEFGFEEESGSDQPQD